MSRVLALFTLLVAFPLAMQAMDSLFYVSLASRMLIYAIAATSLNLVLGYGGMVSFGHAAFFGAGAFTVGILAAEGVSSLWLAWPAALLFGRLAARFGAKPALLGGLALFFAVTVYASTMHSAREFWLLGCAVALILGGCQALSRSLYASFIPAGKSAEFFSFFAISGKFASIFGPLLFAATVDLTGSTRLAILAIAALFAAGLLLLLLVDVERGQAQARNSS